MKPQIDSMEIPWHQTRRLELDWLRVLAFGLLIFYHVGMLYADGWGWHYKSHYLSEFLPNIMMWSNQWRMSLLFLISGVAVSFLLHNMPYWQFYRTRHSKILLPLLFGMTVVVVPQVYIEMASKNLIADVGYGEFWWAYLDQTNPMFEQAKTLGTLHITWNHLWFLMYIFSYSLIVWSLYPLINSQFLRGFWLWLNGHMPKWMLLAGPILGFYFIGMLLWEDYPTTHAFWGDWHNHAKSLSCFLLGFALVRSSRLWGGISELRWLALIGASLTYAYTLFAFNGIQLGEGEFWQELNGLLWSANGWLWILTVIAWAQHKLVFTNAALRYLNGGVYCFYILHQTAIIVIAYFLVPVQLGPVLEPVLVMSGTAISCWLGYEVLGRIPLLSMLLGVKKRPFWGRPSVRQIPMGRKTATKIPCS